MVYTPSSPPPAALLCKRVVVCNMCRCCIRRYWRKRAECQRILFWRVYRIWGHSHCCIFVCCSFLGKSIHLVFLYIFLNKACIYSVKCTGHRANKEHIKGLLYKCIAVFNYWVLLTNRFKYDYVLCTRSPLTDDSIMANM